MRPGDLPAVAGLCAELGYPTSSAEVAARFEDLAGRLEEALFVAETPGASVIGFVHVGIVRALTHAPEARIHGLVVASGERGRGTGRLLLGRAESWSVSRGLPRVRLTSRVIREDAHRFYERAGYGRTKTSHVFEKELPPP
jgi:ribosomal protein S18 acetylase RimI-like enzyme